MQKKKKKIYNPPKLKTNHSKLKANSMNLKYITVI